MDEHRLAKRKFVHAFFEEYRRRLQNIKSLYKVFPSEGLVLAYCFTEAIGYYRYGFGDSKLSSIEQFVKVLYDYQQNERFFVLPPLVIRQLPLEKAKREIGRSIKLELLKWLKSNYSERIGLSIDLVWRSVPSGIKDHLTESEKRSVGHLYEITWGGWYYDLIRTAGVHKAHFPNRTNEQDWLEISKAAEEVLENVREECLEKISFPHQLPQPTSLF